MTTLIEQTFVIYQNLKMLEFLRLLDILAETNLLQSERHLCLNIMNLNLHFVIL